MISDSDLGRPGQNAVLERWPELRADIVVTGLPAQNEALSDAFLDRVQPRIVIVADSEYPVWERASQKFCQRLAKRKTPVLYTRSGGAAVIELRGKHWEIRTMSGDQFVARKRGSRVALAARDKYGLALFVGESIERLLDG